ncbi:hypothetical protein K458DRAFT_451261 [Lentithecium fluviatile CBS 122367]|uniref:Uncharacterized protein n=1 Tax=Lentithecium fluviatile CBS 122367 TaxID=1168545 RepID=A0A6G1J2F9_9PLEO|nr:hypothetical protein K458DRAFT_451261 [Lentithecium fluviatile CBS 122367]
MRAVRMAARAPASRGHDPGLNPKLGQGWGGLAVDWRRDPRSCAQETPPGRQRQRGRLRDGLWAAACWRPRGTTARVGPRQAARSLALGGWDEGDAGAHLSQQQRWALAADAGARSGSAARGLGHAVGSWNDAGWHLLEACWCGCAATGIASLFDGAGARMVVVHVCRRSLLCTAAGPRSHLPSTSFVLHGRVRHPRRCRSCQRAASLCQSVPSVPVKPWRVPELEASASAADDDDASAGVANDGC